MRALSLSVPKVQQNKKQHRGLRRSLSGKNKMLSLIRLS